MVELHLGFFSKKFDCHDCAESTAGAVGAGRVLTTVTGGDWVLEQAIFSDLIQVRCEVIQS